MIYSDFTLFKLIHVYCIYYFEFWCIEYILYALEKYHGYEKKFYRKIESMTVIDVPDCLSITPCDQNIVLLKCTVGIHFIKYWKINPMVEPWNQQPTDEKTINKHTQLKYKLLIKDTVSLDYAYSLTNK